MKNMKLWDWVVWNQRLKKKHSSKKKLRLLCVYINDWYYQINTWKQWHRSNNRWCYHIIAKWKAYKRTIRPWQYTSNHKQIRQNIQKTQIQSSRWSNKTTK